MTDLSEDREFDKLAGRQLLPPSQFLRIRLVSEQLQVSQRGLARAAGLSVSSLHVLISRDVWPKRSSRELIEQRLSDHLRAAGASEAQLQGLFDPVERRDRPADKTAANRYLRPTREDQEEPDMLLPKQNLTRKAAKAFRLFQNPFDGEVIDDESMFTSDEISYVREQCIQAAKSGRFVAVVGESGAGKTTIQADLESRIQRERMPVVVIKPYVLGMEDSDAKGKTLKSADILAAIISSLDPLEPVPQTLQARSNRAHRMLMTSAEAGNSHLLVIEEAHSMPDATLKHLKRLNEMKVGRKPLLGILLLGQTELALKLDPKRANLREVVQRCEVVQLLPLDGDLQAYLEHRATLVNRSLGEFIDEQGLQELRARLTVSRPAPGGKPRMTSLLYPLAVNNLLTAALNVAADLGIPIVNRDVVRAV